MADWYLYEISTHLCGYNVQTQAQNWSIHWTFIGENIVLTIWKSCDKNLALEALETWLQEMLTRSLVYFSQLFTPV